MSIRFRTFVFLLLILLNEGQRRDLKWETPPNGTTAPPNGTGEPTSGTHWSVGDIFNTLSSSMALPIAYSQTLVTHHCGIKSAEFLTRKLADTEYFLALRELAQEMEFFKQWLLARRGEDKVLFRRFSKVNKMWNNIFETSLFAKINSDVKDVLLNGWKVFSRIVDGGVAFLHFGNLFYDTSEVTGWQKITVYLIDVAGVGLNAAEVYEAGKIESLLNPTARLFFVFAKTNLMNLRTLVLSIKTKRVLVEAYMSFNALLASTIEDDFDMLISLKELESRPFLEDLISQFLIDSDSRDILNSKISEILQPQKLWNFLDLVHYVDLKFPSITEEQRIFLIAELVDLLLNPIHEAFKFDYTVGQFYSRVISRTSATLLDLIAFNQARDLYMSVFPGMEEVGLTSSTVWDWCAQQIEVQHLLQTEAIFLSLSNLTTLEITSDEMFDKYLKENILALSSYENANPLKPFENLRLYTDYIITNPEPLKETLTSPESAEEMYLDSSLSVCQNEGGYNYQRFENFLLAYQEAYNTEGVTDGVKSQLLDKQAGRVPKTYIGKVENQKVSWRSRSGPAPITFTFGIKPPPSLETSLPSLTVVPLETFYPSDYNEKAEAKFNPVFLTFPRVPVTTTAIPDWAIPLAGFFSSLLYIASGVISLAFPNPVTPLIFAAQSAALQYAISSDITPYFQTTSSPFRRLKDAKDSSFLKIINGMNISEDDKIIVEHYFYESVLKPLTFGADNNHPTTQILANMSAIAASAQNSHQYQEILKSQFSTLTNDSNSADEAAAKVFRKVEEEQRNVLYKHFYNNYDYEEKKQNQETRRLLVEGDDFIYHAQMIIEDYRPYIYKVKFQITNFNLQQRDDLFTQMNKTIVNFITSFHWKVLLPRTLTFDEIIYLVEEEPDTLIQLEKISHDQVDVIIHNFEQSLQDTLVTLLNGTVENFFYMTLDVEKNDLISSVREASTGLTDSESDGSVVAAFKAIQTDRNYYKVDFDASASYSLWSNSLTYKWDFGDGTTERGQNLKKATHLYMKAGEYLVTLEVTNSWNRKAFAQSATNITIVYTSVEPEDGALAYIGSRNQNWMFVTGNVYEPIHNFLSGANEATLFKIEKSGSYFRIRTTTVSETLTSNYLGFWHYPSVSPVELQASSLYKAGVLPDHTAWDFEPWGAGYWRIYNKAVPFKQLNISGYMVENFDPDTCLFTFVAQPLEKKPKLISRLYSFGSESISSIRVKNLINSNSKNPIILTNPSTAGQLFNFIPSDQSGFYQIADILNQNYLVSGNGIYKGVTLKKADDSIQNSQLWSLGPIGGVDSSQFELRNQVNNDYCMNAEINSKQIILDTCSAKSSSNKIFCSDKHNRMVTYSTCKQPYDTICCGSPWLLAIPFVGAKKYRESCKPCKSGYWYCQSALNEAKLIKESKLFKKNSTSTVEEKCDFQSDYNPLNSWYFDRIDASALQDEKNKLITGRGFMRNNVKIYNVGWNQYLCQSDDSDPYLCSGGTPIDIMTWSVHGELNDPSDDQAGYYFRGTGGKYFCGPYNEIERILVQRSLSDTKGHFWHIDVVGYNVYQMRYEWNMGRYCLTPDSTDYRSKEHKGRVFLQFERCDVSNRNQYWSFIETE